MRSTSDIKLALQNVLAKYGYIMPKDLYLAIEDLHDEIESDREWNMPVQSKDYGSILYNHYLWCLKEGRNIDWFYEEKTKEEEQASEQKG